MLVHHLLQAEKFEEGLLQFLVGSFGQEFAHQGRGFHVLRVPSLLVIESTVRIPIGIAEGDVTDIVAHQGRHPLAEVIFHLVQEQRPTPGDDVHQPALPSPIGPYQGQLFAFGQGKIDRLLHPVRRMSGHSIHYFDDRLHDLLSVLMPQS